MKSTELSASSVQVYHSRLRLHEELFRQASTASLFAAVHSLDHCQIFRRLREGQRGTLTAPPSSD